MRFCNLLQLTFFFTINSDILVANRLKRQSGHWINLPDSSDILDKSALPPLVFPGQNNVDLVSGQDKNLETIRNQINEIKLITDIANKAGSVLGMIPKAGGTIQDTVSTLASYLGSVTQLEELKTDIKIELGIDKAIVRHSLSNFKSEIHALKSRLDEITSPLTTNDEKKYSVIPAIHSCQKIAQLFADREYIMWNYKSIFAPYLILFASLYTTTARIAVELLPLQKTLLGNEMGIILQTLNEYEPEVQRSILKHIKVYDEYHFSKRICPKIKIFYVDRDFSEWEQKIREWKSETFNPQKSGCVLGDSITDDKIGWPVERVFLGGAKVFKNEITGDVFCGYENCLKNLKEIYYGKLHSLFDETRSLFPAFTNRNDVSILKLPPINGVEDYCERDEYGRLSNWHNNDENSYGCHKGYCWAYCIIPFSFLKDWCYTTRWGHKYVECSKKEDCCPEWSCGGACWAY